MKINFKKRVKLGSQAKLGSRGRLGNQQGMTVIEVAVAMAILAIVGGALVSIALTTVAMTTTAKLKTRATALAVERIEELKACKEQRGALPTLPDCGITTPETVEGIFTRGTTINSGTDESAVIVIVSWQERGRTRNVTLETKLSIWKVREATD